MVEVLAYFLSALQTFHVLQFLLSENQHSDLLVGLVVDSLEDSGDP